jgi:hypothetical protein
MITGKRRREEISDIRMEEQTGCKGIRQEEEQKVSMRKGGRREGVEGGNIFCSLTN